PSATTPSGAVQRTASICEGPTPRYPPPATSPASLIPLTEPIRPRSTNPFTRSQINPLFRYGFVGSGGEKPAITPDALTARADAKFPPSVPMSEMACVGSHANAWNAPVAVVEFPATTFPAPSAATVLVVPPSVPTSTVRPAMVQKKPCVLPDATVALPMIAPTLLTASA